MSRIMPTWLRVLIPTLTKAFTYVVGIILLGWLFLYQSSLGVGPLCFSPTLFIFRGFNSSFLVSGYKALSLIMNEPWLLLLGLVIPVISSILTEWYIAYRRKNFIGLEQINNDVFVFAPTMHSIRYSFPISSSSSVYSRLFPNHDMSCYLLIIPFVMQKSMEAGTMLRIFLPTHGPIVAHDLGYLLSYMVVKFDLKEIDLPKLIETNVHSVKFLHFDLLGRQNIRDTILILLSFEGYVGTGGVNPMHMIDVAATTGASTIASNEAAQAFRDILNSMVNVNIILTEEEQNIILNERKFIRFTRTNDITHDHPLMAAYREIIRTDFERIINLRTINERVLILGASMREYRAYNSNAHIYFQFANIEAKDLDRTIMECLQTLRKLKVRKFNKSMHTIDDVNSQTNRLKDVDQAMREWRETRKIPERILLWEDTKGFSNGTSISTKFDTLIFQDVGYNFNTKIWGKIFRATNALRAYGYMCLPWELIVEDIVSPPGYVYKRTNNKATLAYHGYCTGYTHDYDSWSTLMRTPVLIFKDFSIGIEFISRVGPMTLIRLYKTTKQETIVRHLELPKFLKSTQLLNVTACFDRKNGVLNTTNLKYFPVRTDEFQEAVNYGLDIAKDSLNFNNILLFIRRRSSGISLVTKEISKTWTAPKGLLPEFALVVYIYVTYLCNDFVRFQQVSKTMNISRFTEMIRKKTKIFVDFYRIIYNYFAKEDIFHLLIKDVDHSFWQSVTIAKFSKFQEIIDTDLRPEDLLTNALEIKEEEDVLYEPECNFCLELKSIVGSQIFTCERHKEEIFFHNFTLSNSDVNVLRAMLSDTSKDTIGIKTIKEEALKHTPITGFSNRVKVQYICGPPGTGKSYAIRALATKQDLVIASFSRLRQDYTNFNHPISGIKTSLRFMTQHVAFSAMNHSRIFVDEYTAMPYECLAVIVNNCAADEVFLVGDHRQTSLINEVEGIAIPSRLPIPQIRTHELIKNFRNPIDAVNVLNSAYGYRMLATNKHKGFIIDTTNNYDNYHDYTPLFFRHTSASNFGLDESTGSKVTVRANQGATYDKVKLVIMNGDKNLFEIPSMVIVALSRHRSRCVLLFEDSSITAPLKGIITSAMNKTKQKLPDNLSPIFVYNEEKYTNEGVIIDNDTDSDDMPPLEDDDGDIFFDANSDLNNDQNDNNSRKHKDDNSDDDSNDNPPPPGHGKSHTTINTETIVDSQLPFKSKDKVIATPTISSQEILPSENIRPIVAQNPVYQQPIYNTQHITPQMVMPFYNNYMYQPLNPIINPTYMQQPPFNYQITHTPLLNLAPPLIRNPMYNYSNLYNMNIPQFVRPNFNGLTTENFDNVQQNYNQTQNITETINQQPVNETTTQVDSDTMENMQQTSKMNQDMPTTSRKHLRWADLTEIQEEDIEEDQTYIPIIHDDEPSTTYTIKRHDNDDDDNQSGNTQKSISVASLTSQITTITQSSEQPNQTQSGKTDATQDLTEVPTDNSCLLQALAKLTNNNIEHIWYSMISSLGISWAYDIRNKALSTKELWQFCIYNDFQIIVISNKELTTCGVRTPLIGTIYHTRSGPGHFYTQGHTSKKTIRLLISKNLFSKNIGNNRSITINELQKYVQNLLGYRKSIDHLTIEDLITIHNHKNISVELWSSLVYTLENIKTKHFWRKLNSKLKLVKFSGPDINLIGASDVQIYALPNIDILTIKDTQPQPFGSENTNFLQMARLYANPVYLSKLLVNVDIDTQHETVKLEQSPFDCFKMLIEDYATIDEDTLILTNQESFEYVSKNFGNGSFDMTTLDNLNQRGHPQARIEKAWSLLNVAPGVTYSKRNLAQTLHCLQSRYLTTAYLTTFTNESKELANVIASLFFEEHMELNFDIFNEQDIFKTVLESEHSMKIKNYDKQATFDTFGHRDVRFAMKDIFKPFKTKIDVFKAGQGISAWSKDMQSIFQTSFRIINKHFISCLKPHVVYDNGIDEQALMLRVNGLFSLLPSTALNGVIDATACDSGQNRFTQIIERVILEKLGISDIFLDWYYEQREEYILKGYGVKAKVKDIKTSGEPATLLNNTILMACLMNYLIRGEGPCVLVIKGDDGLKRQANIKFTAEAQSRLNKHLKMEFKIDIDVPITFCGYFLYKQHLYPDIIRKVFKILGHRFRDYEHFSEYQQSLRDWILVVNKLGLSNICLINSEAYSIQFEYCYSTLHSIISLTHINRTQFMNFFSLKTLCYIEEFVSTEPWKQTVDWYHGYN